MHGECRTCKNWFSLVFYRNGIAEITLTNSNTFLMDQIHLELVFSIKAPGSSLVDLFQMSVSVKGKGLTAAEVLQNYNETEHYYTKSIVTNGLVLNLDAGDVASYPKSNWVGSGTTWTDLSGQGNDGTY